MVALLRAVVALPATVVTLVVIVVIVVVVVPMAKEMKVVYPILIVDPNSAGTAPEIPVFWLMAV